MGAITIYSLTESINQGNHIITYSRHTNIMKGTTCTVMLRSGTQKLCVGGYFNTCPSFMQNTHYMENAHVTSYCILLVICLYFQCTRIYMYVCCVHVACIVYVFMSVYLQLMLVFKQTKQRFVCGCCYTHSYHGNEL